MQAEAGVLSVTGTPDTPSKVGISIGDIATGMYAYSGILMALYQREKSGQGTRIEVTRSKRSPSGWVTRFITRISAARRRPALALTMRRSCPMVVIKPETVKA